MKKNYKIKTYNTFNSELKKEWKFVENECYYSPFQSYEWLSHWYEKIGKKQKDIYLCVIVFKFNEYATDIFPLCVNKKKQIKILEWIGGINTDYMCSLHTNKSILISNSYNNLEIWDLIKNQIPNFDLIYLEKQPDYFGLKINFFLDFFVKKESLVSYKAVFDCNWNEYKKTNVKKKILSENKRRIRRLKSLGNLEFIIETNNKTYLDALKIILYQKEQKYIESGYNMFENQQYKFLYLNCKKDLGKLGNTHISTLRINNKIIAGHWGFISKDTLYHVIPSYENAKWAKYSPGTILLEYLMEWACKSGLKKFDFTEGYAKYKSNWANHKVFLYETIYPNTIKGKIYITLKKIKNKYFQWECSKKFNIIKYYMKLSLQKFIKKIKIEH